MVLAKQDHNVLKFKEEVKENKFYLITCSNLINILSL